MKKHVLGKSIPFFYWVEDMEGLSIFKTILVSYSDGTMKQRTEFVQSHWHKASATFICNRLNEGK